MTKQYQKDRNNLKDNQFKNKKKQSTVPGITKALIKYAINYQILN